MVEVISVKRGTDDVLAPADYEVDAGGKVLYLLQGGVRCPWSNWCFDHNCYPDGRHRLRPDGRVPAGYTLPKDDQGADWTLPADVERAAIMAVSTMLSSKGRDPLLKSENVMGFGSFTYATPAASTPAGGLVNAEAQALLWPLRAGGARMSPEQAIAALDRQIVLHGDDAQHQRGTSAAASLRLWSGNTCPRSFRAASRRATGRWWCRRPTWRRRGSPTSGSSTS